MAKDIFQLGRPETLADWKSESVTDGGGYLWTDGGGYLWTDGGGYLWTDRLTWVGARDTCVSKKVITDHGVIHKLARLAHTQDDLLRCEHWPFFSDWLDL